MTKFITKLQDFPNEVWNKIIRIDELKGQWVAGAKLDRQVLGRLKSSVLITSTGASTRIEGAKLSDEDIEKLMRGVSIQKWKDRDKQEIKGYYELLNNVFDSWESIRMSENCVKHFHKEMLKYVEKDKKHRGKYKTTENKVMMVDKAGRSKGILFDTTPAYLTAKEMQELVESMQKVFEEKIFHPLLIIAAFLVELLHIHPFQDGNGRISRILTNLLLIKAGYLYMPYVSHEKIIEDNKPDYYIALRKTQKTLKTKKPDMVPWLNFFLFVILKQSEMAVELLSKENIEKLLSVKQLAIWKYFQGVDEVPPGDIAKELQIARPTVNQALDKLLRLNKIERVGLGRSTRYRKI